MKTIDSTETDSAAQPQIESATLARLPLVSALTALNELARD